MWMLYGDNLTLGPLTCAAIQVVPKEAAAHMINRDPTLLCATGSCTSNLQKMLEQAVKFGGEARLYGLLHEVQEPHTVLAVNEAVIENAEDL